MLRAAIRFFAPEWRVKVVRPVVALIMLALATFVLHRELADLSLSAIAQRMGNVPVSELAMAGGLVVLSFAIGGLYEAVTLKAVGYPLGWFRPMTVYTIANSIGHCLGWSLVTGGALRWRLYERDGLTKRAIAAMAVMSAAPFFLGSWLLLALASIAGASALGARLKIDVDAIKVIGVVTLLCFAVTLAFLSRRGTINIGRFRLSTPGRKLLSIQVIAGMIELAIVASMLYVLLGREADVTYAQFLASYIAAVLLGQISSVPAGIGVLEASLLMLLPQVAPASLIAAVASYRVVYEGLPLIAGLLILFGVELRWRYGTLRACNNGRASRKPTVLPRL